MIDHVVRISKLVPSLMDVFTFASRTVRPARPDAIDEPHLGRRSAALEVARLLGRPQPVAPWTLSCGTRLTAVWTHGGFKGYAAGADDHSIVAHHRHAQQCSWAAENRRLTATLRPGTLTLVPATHDGYWTAAGWSEVSHVYLSDKRLQSCAQQLGTARPVRLVARLGQEDSAVARVLELLGQEASRQSAPTLFLEEALDLLCLQLIRRHSAFPDTRSSPPRRGLTGRQVRLVTGYIRENLDREITLEELARLIHLSRFHFCAAFRLATGKRPHEWLTIQRIERARALLQDSALPIIDIGLSVGYRTPSAFAAAFRRIVGDTPSNYRRQV